MALFLHAQVILFPNIHESKKTIIFYHIWLPPLMENITSWLIWVIVIRFKNGLLVNLISTEDWLRLLSFLFPKLSFLFFYLNEELAFMKRR